MTRFSTPLTCLATCLLFACGSADDETATDTPPAETAESGPDLSGIPEAMRPERVVDNLEIIAPEGPGDIAIFTDVVRLPPGADATFCTFGPVLTEAKLAGASFGSQSAFGHHAIAQYATEPREPGTRPCGATDMDFSQLLGGTGGKEASTEDNLPDNVAIEIPAGAQLVINHHYINTGSEEAEVQSMMVVRDVPASDDVILAGTTTVGAFSWEIPPQSPFEATSECTFGEDVDYFMTLGHMHEWGTYVSVDLTRTDGTVERIIDQPWSAADATGDAPVENYAVDEPLSIHAGDKVTLHCEWENDTDDPIAFPREMCIFFGYTLGQRFICGEGAWLTPEQAAAAAAQSGFDINSGI